MSHVLLEVENIQKSFGGLRAIDGVWFTLNCGQVLGLIGPNGAGKTTIFNIISGIYRTDHGTVRLDGEDVTNRKPEAIARRGVARTFQVPRTFNNMTVEENLRVPGVRLRLSQRESRTRAAAALDEMGLYEVRHRLVSELAGGQRKLIELARAAIVPPKLLILDEPFAGASADVIDRMLEQVRRWADQGAGCLVISHDIASMPRLCKDVLVLTEGAVLTAGKLENVRQDPRVVEAYLGS